MSMPWPRVLRAPLWGAAVVAIGAALAVAGEGSSGIFRLADPGHAAAPSAREVAAAHRPPGGLLSARWARGANLAAFQAAATDAVDADERAELLPEPGETPSDREPAVATATDAAPLRWASPHEITSDELPALGPCGWLPIGIKPWGPRTPDRFRYVGLGEPLEGASWRNRPCAAGWFAGVIDGARLTAAVDEHEGFFGGYRFGCDYDHYYGWETRIGGAAIGLSDPTGGVGSATADLVLWDLDWVYYPWGDSRWRPFVFCGLGIVNVDFTDQNNRGYNEWYLGVPWGLGLKYRCHEWLVLRAEITDNLAIGNPRLDALNDWSLTAGVEVRFGGVRKSYWPWYPGRHLW